LLPRVRMEPGLVGTRIHVAKRSSAAAVSSSRKRLKVAHKVPAVPARRVVGKESRKTGNAYLRIAENFRVRILTGSLKPGDRLPNESDLAREEGVGRTTVREALRLLASSRLIETRRGVRGGAFVTHPSTEDLDDAMMTALSLMTMSGGLSREEIAEATQYTMPMIARIAAARGTDEEVGKLVVVANLLADTRNDDEWVEVGSRFNLLLVEMARSRLLSMLIKPLMRLSPLQYKEHRAAPAWREKTAVLYRELADAIRRRAPAAAEEAMIRLRERYTPVNTSLAPDTTAHAPTNPPRKKKRTSAAID
jgi:GntR family transcriptional regulator, transcriptional repressor for pyruvate dehydrogenase complex